MRLDSPIGDMGTVGIWAWEMVTHPAEDIRNAARAIEDMGYGSLWFPESTGREAFATSSILLEATSSIVVAPGIANLWARDAMAMANGARSLGEAHPGRFVLGVGVSHAPSVARRGSTYERPIGTMAAYLDGMESAVYTGPEPSTSVPVVLAALGPRMLHLAGTRTAGAHPYFVPIDHTVVARETLGADPWLAPEQAVVLETDATAARVTARRHMAPYLTLANYANNLRRIGWTEGDIADGGSDALVDAVVAWGDVEAIAERVAAHLDAGADHVSLQVLSPDGEIRLDDMERLAPAVIG